jgi:hypothetical protein
MIGGIFSGLARIRFTVGYLSVLLVVAGAIALVGPRGHDLLVQHASTNLHNLAHGRLMTLLDSAFVVDAGPMYFWLPFLTCLLVLAEVQLHTMRVLTAFLVGHVGATLVVAAVLAAAVELEWMPVSVTRAPDTGMSYGALAVLGALTATIPRRWWPVWIGWWVSAGITAAVVDADFTNVGHSVAVILGVLVAATFRQPVRWTLPRAFMLMNSAGFGFLVLAHHWWSMAIVLGFGAVGAALGAFAVHRVARLRASRVELPASVPEDGDALAGPEGPKPAMTGSASAG